MLKKYLARVLYKRVLRNSGEKNILRIFLKKQDETN